jgi:hypothetical protein
MKPRNVHRKLQNARWRINLAVVITLVVSLNSWPQPAQADWRSLTDLVPEYVSRLDFQISPDSRTVAFVSDIETEDIYELYAVAITETVSITDSFPFTPATPIKLNPPLVKDGVVEPARFAFTPDSQSIIYLADQEVDNRIEMFSVPVGGGQSVKLNPPLVAGGNIQRFTIDADSGRIIYVADQETNEVFELWSIPIGGGTSVKLNGAFVLGGNVNRFEIDEVGNRVVYSADQETNGKFELYSVPVAGGTAVKLNPPVHLTGGGDSGLCCEFEVHPSFPVVVFIAREADAPRGRLYMSPTAASELTKLGFELAADQHLLHFRISPLGDRVVFDVGTNSGSTNAQKGNLYSNLIGGDATTIKNVSETADPTFGTRITDFFIMPNGQYVIYRYQKNAASPEQLVSATMDGMRVPLYTVSGSNDPLTFFRLSPNSQWVMYETTSGFPVHRIQTIPPTGGNDTGFGVADFKLITPDSARIAYTRVVSGENNTELFTQQIFGGAERNLSGMNGEGFIGDVKVSEDGKWFVFRVHLNGPDDLRVSDGAEAQPSVTPSPTITATVTPTVTTTVTPTGTATETPTESPTPTETPVPGDFHSHLPSVSSREPED